MFFAFSCNNFQLLETKKAAPEKWKTAKKIDLISYLNDIDVLSASLEVDFVKETVEILIRDHGISLHKETLIHSDQGSHYTSTTFIQIIEDSNLRRSMSRRGNCWDNAPQESFFGHMKDHISAKVKGCTEFQQIQDIINDYIDYY